MDELDLKQYNEIKHILKTIETSEQGYEDIKVTFTSSPEQKDKVYASYQFPIISYNEDIYLELKEYAQLNYRIAKRNNMNVGQITNLNFNDPTTNLEFTSYNFFHSPEFLEEVNTKRL